MPIIPFDPTGIPSYDFFFNLTASIGTYIALTLAVVFTIKDRR